MTGRGAWVLGGLLMACAGIPPKPPDASSTTVTPDGVESKRHNDFGVLNVSGHLAPKVIIGVVREANGLFRTCYKQALDRNIKLEGRIKTRFVIGLDGAVTNAADGGSDLPDAEAVQCVLAQFFKIKFPAPDGGIVTVLYPMMFSPAEPARQN